MKGSKEMRYLRKQLRDDTSERNLKEYTLKELFLVFKGLENPRSVLRLASFQMSYLLILLEFGS